MNILLSSAGRRTYMVEYFKQALGGKGKVFTSNSVLTCTLERADEYVLTPSIYNEGYIPFLIDYCKRKEIDSIISLFDIDLPVLAKNRKLFEKEGIRLIISDYDVISICNDKWLSYEFLNEIGIKQTPSFISLKEAEEAVDDGTVDFPLFVKPRWGMGSMGVYKVDDIEELNVLYKKLSREIFSTYLKDESSNHEDSCIIIQKAIKGQEYGIEVLNDLNGNYIATFAKKKIAMRSGETDIAETVSSKQFEAVGKRLSENLKHIAILDVDCFIDENGDIVVLEMNCRFGGQYPFTHNAGVNIPLQIIRWLENKPTDKSLVSQKDGVRSCKELVPVIF